MSKTLDDILNIVYRRSDSESPYHDDLMDSLVIEEIPGNFGPNIVDAQRAPHSLANEYFAQEVFSAAGIPSFFCLIVEAYKHKSSFKAS